MAYQLTNSREVLAYFAAQAIRIAAIYLLSSLNVLVPLYKWAYSTGGSLAVLPVSFGLSLMWMGLALPLFLIGRGILEGVPAIVAAAGRAGAITTTAAEIGAYVVAHLIGILVVMSLSSLVLFAVYASLYRAGSPGSARLLGLAVSIIATVAVFLIFVALRRAFTGARQPGRT
ncbi:MAG TPA: hypothetical protein VGS13_01615 [Stellaceae bacterium]|nr:hypothetical protein [Stellaceae bacterium]